MKRRILVLTTGGTFEKTYRENDGELENKDSVLRSAILSKLRLPSTDVVVREIMAKDSLEMTDDDRNLIVQTIEVSQKDSTPIIVLHGTDTMEKTASLCFEKIKTPQAPIVFTGAMKPAGFIDSDAKQNFTEALMAAQLAEPGVFISFHNQLLKVPGAKKNREKGTFEG